MSINRIEIDIKDKRWFGLVAFLVDRPDFLAEIKQIRDILQIKSLPYTFSSSSYQEVNNVIDGYTHGIARIFDVHQCFKDICAKRGIFMSELDEKLSVAYGLSKNMTKRFSKNPLYLPVTLAAILVGTIHDSEVIPTTGLVIDKESINDLQDELQDNEKRYAIIVNRESKWKEVKQTFDFMERYCFGTKVVKNKEDDSIYKLYYEELPTDTLSHTRPNIKEDRDLYWRNLNGESYFQIAKNDNGGNSYYLETVEAMKNGSQLSETEKEIYRKHIEAVDIYKDKVEKAITRYKKQLTDI